MEANMNNVINITNYGIALFSPMVLQDYLKKEKIRSKKLLSKFEKEKDIYVKTLEEGIWIPIVKIDAGSYVIKVAGKDESFDDTWIQKFSYEGFQIEIKDTLCIGDIHLLEPFQTNQEMSYQDMEGNVINKGCMYAIASGKYQVCIEGYVRKKAKGHTSTYDNPEYGFLFTLKQIDAFKNYQDPREDEQYNFNIGYLTRSKQAMIKWDNETIQAHINKEYYPVMELEDGNVCHLYLEFDSTKEKCRVSVLYKYTYDQLLMSGNTFTISEEIRKKGKNVLCPVGTLTIL